MKKPISILALVLLLSGLHQVSAQQITDQKIFKVKGYYINTVGYPSPAVPIGDDKFAYVEFWTPGEGRRYNNYYLQGYDLEFNELWFQPTAKAGTPELNIFHLTRLKSSIGLVGKQYSASMKGYKTMVSFFGEDGRVKGNLMTMSNYDKKASKKGAQKKYEDYLAQSVDGSKLLWMGHNPSEKYKKRAYFFSCWGDNGRQIWSKKLRLPGQDEKYLVKQATVDEKGNMYLLMEYELMTNSEKDTLNRPMILRYDSREGKFSVYKLDFKNSSFPTGSIHINKEGELVYVGILADGSEGGFLNGAKTNEAALRWNKIVYKQFNISRELSLSQESVLDIPESWVKKYGTEGANFSKSELMEHEGKLYWVMEEFYTQIHNKQLQYAYNDVGVIAFDMKKGEIDWASSFDKRQRDYSSGRLLSYVPGIARGKLHFVYLNERGAQGRIRATSMSLADGSTENTDLASNQKADYLFFPKRSAMVNGTTMILMGVGDPVGNDYKLMKVSF